MNLFETYKSFLAEAFLLRNYKRMSKVKAVLSGIVMLPFIFAFAIMMLLYGATIILHKFLNAPTDYVYSFVKKEGDEVKHGTQAVIYFVAFPLIFMLKALSGFLVFNLFIIHFISVVLGYVATLGGISVSLFLFDKKAEANYVTDDYKPKTVSIFLIISLTLIILSIILTPIVGALGITASLVEQTVNQNKSYTYDEFLAAVRDRHNDGKMTDVEYSNFEFDVRMGTVNEDNYNDYVDRYLPTSSVSVDSIINTALSGIGVVIAFVASLGIGSIYGLFVVIYILIFFRLKKKPEEAEEPVSA